MLIIENVRERRYKNYSRLPITRPQVREIEKSSSCREFEANNLNKHGEGMQLSNEVYRDGH